MFSLVLTLVAIALAAALALATLYYGGSSFSKGSEQANASQLINTGQQIAGALQLRDADLRVQGEPTSSAMPDSRYLRTVPTGWSVECESGVCQVRKSLSLADTAVCRAVNKHAGLGETLDLTVFGMASSLFHCAATTGPTGTPTGYVFSYLYRLSS